NEIKGKRKRRSHSHYGFGVLVLLGYPSMLIMLDWWKKLHILYHGRQLRMNNRNIKIIEVKRLFFNLFKSGQVLLGILYQLPQINAHTDPWIILQLLNRLIEQLD